MPRQEPRYEGAEHQGNNRQYRYQVGIEADEGIDSEEGHSLGGTTPGEDTDDPGLELEDDADASIKSAEVVGHCRNVEVGALGIGWCQVVSEDGRITSDIVIGGNDLLEKSASTIVRC